MMPPTLLLIMTIMYTQATHISQPPRLCTQPGPMCETCTTLVTCIENSDGTWTKNTAGTCLGHSEKCFNGTCTTQPEPICDGTADLTFICRQVGIFPDPFYCNKFVLCVERGSHFMPYVYECSDGYGYNAGTAICDVKLEDGQCPEGEYPVPVCDSIGESGALEDNDSIFYTCEEYRRNSKMLYPVLDQCPHGEVYRDYGCHDDGDGTTMSV